MVWFLDADGRGVQWGYLPRLWPKGVVRRLPSWGWEICNLNVCMRALDYDAALEATRGQEEGHKAALRDAELWGDLLDSLEWSQVRFEQADGTIAKATLRRPTRCEIPGMPWGKSD